MDCAPALRELVQITSDYWEESVVVSKRPVRKAASTRTTRVTKIEEDEETENSAQSSEDSDDYDEDAREEEPVPAKGKSKEMTKAGKLSNAMSENMSFKEILE